MTTTKKTKKQTTPKKKQSSSFSFTRKELFLWVGVICLSMVWMFILGIVVGRGLSPVRFDVEKLKQEIVELKQEALQAKTEGNRMEEEADERHLGFYDILTEKKEMARLKTLEKEPDAPSRKDVLPPAEPEPAEADPADEEPAKRLVSEKRLLSTTADKSSAVSYTLQIASFRDTLKAEEFVSTLQRKGYNAYQVAAHVDGKGTYHRVRIGHFSNKDAAGNLLARLKKENLNPLLIRE